MIEPIVKWPGGKRKTADAIVAALGAPRRYVEPFVGGAAVAMALRAAHRGAQVILGDTFAPIVTVYREVIADPAAVSAELDPLVAAYLAADAERRAQIYYGVRRALNVCEIPPAELAAAFLFLNKACFNGLVRTNAAGKFNAAHGRYANPAFPDRGHLTEFARLLAGALSWHATWQATLAAGELVAGDAVYLDPPYDDGFVGYSGAFAWEEQVELARAAGDLLRRGVRVVASNRATPRILEIWSGEGFAVRTVGVRHSINRNGADRKVVDEMLATPP